MAQLKVFNEMKEQLDRIEAAIATKKKAAPAVTKEQLMEIKGVGSSTADEILKLFDA
jgi:endonuclease III-like uncharacterized protein